MISPKVNTAIIVSGYFNPIHKGHIEYFQNAKKLADLLFVIVNSDYQRKIKGSKPFQDEAERLIIVGNIKAVDKVFLSIDKNRTFVTQLKKYLMNLVLNLNYVLQTEAIKIMTLFQKKIFALSLV